MEKMDSEEKKWEKIDSEEKMDSEESKWIQKSKMESEEKNGENGFRRAKWRKWIQKICSKGIQHQVTIKAFAEIR
uniref:Uncharacterized protein n=1 Tax=Acrobeloides nanus TaxID=290746 RepID=A0A914DC69_9BILA